MRRNATASVMVISVKVGGHGTTAGNHRPSLGGLEQLVDVFQGSRLVQDEANGNPRLRSRGLGLGVVGHAGRHGPGALIGPILWRPRIAFVFQAPGAQLCISSKRAWGISSSRVRVLRSDWGSGCCAERETS